MAPATNIKCKFFAIVWLTALISTRKLEVRYISKRPIVIVTGFKGYRYDYVHSGFNPIFERLVYEGLQNEILEEHFSHGNLPQFLRNFDRFIRGKP